MVRTYLFLELDIERSYIYKGSSLCRISLTAAARADCRCIQLVYGTCTITRGGKCPRIGIYYSRCEVLYSRTNRIEHQLYIKRVCIRIRTMSGKVSMQYLPHSLIPLNHICFSPETLPTPPIHYPSPPIAYQHL
jgi:hypothetical protein